MPSRSSHRRRLRDTRRAHEHEHEQPYVEARNDEPRKRSEPTIPEFGGVRIRATLQDKIDTGLRRAERLAGIGTNARRIVR
jgi:hypothetical protein